MPFGAVYGILFFGVLAFSMFFMASSASGAALETSRFFLGLLSLSLCLGLALRQNWARWLGLVFSAGFATLVLFFASFDGPVTGYLALFGSAVAALLLLVPATGALQRREAPSTSARLAAVAAAVGAVGFVTTLGWGVYRAPDSNVEASRPASLASPALAGRVPWTDFGSGLERARDEGKPMLVNFEVDWCGYCRKMSRTTWKHPGVVERLGDMVSVRVNAEETVERNGFTGKDLASRYGVTGFPTLMLIDVDGRVLNATGGYQEPRQLLTWIEDSLNRPGRSRVTAGLGVSH